MAYIAVEPPAASLVTVTTSAASLFPGSQRKWVHGIEILLRSLGGATYVRVGDRFTQERSLTAAYESVAYTVPDDAVIDASAIFVICDAGAPVLEVTVLDSNTSDAEVMR